MPHRAISVEGWLNVAEAITRMQGSKPSEPSSAKPNRAPVYELQLTEEKALREFWAAAGDPAIDRLNMLRIFAEIAIVRPADWDYAGVRDGAGTNPNVTLSAPNGCFSCGSRRQPLNWHHVIQVQYGGSNGPRNRVAICEPCHAAIHPWVKPVSRSVPGWFCLGGSLCKPRRGQAGERGQKGNRLMNALTFTVPGVAQTKGSTRAFIPKGWTRAIITNDNPKAKGWQQLIAEHASQALASSRLQPFPDCPIVLDVWFYFPRPQKFLTKKYARDRRAAHDEGRR
jgi:hypothetical protein